jgi:uncharacterized membrane protein
MRYSREMTLLIASLGYLVVAIVDPGLARDMLRAYIAVVVTIILIVLLRKASKDA